ncbi:MAG TPA: SDR family NAD(P)-dependent oxidoreductase [Candidatus Acidoferrales bacterium]|nr:SDR family NAD(P)-dependent oxidoreductase [Candidatus Acidoferrales bacterium]
MTMNFASKSVLVAGGTGALGRAVTLQFLDAGATVAVTYRKQEEFDGLAAAAGKNAARLTGHALDVTDETATKQFVNGLAERHGRLDILINAVGGYAGGQTLWESDARTYDQMLALNLRSGYVLARAVVPIMLRQNRGWIVNVASKAGYGHSSGAAVYAASKAAALALFDSLAEEVKAHNINVNSVVPSIMDTPANRQAMPRADFSNWPKPEDVARVILFLCSEEARLIQGAAVPVYGKT